MDKHITQIEHFILKMEKHDMSWYITSTIILRVSKVLYIRI